MISLRRLFQQTFEDHEGRPGKQGGSLPKGSRGSSITPKKKELFRELMSDKKTRNIMIGLAADGSIDDVANITEIIDEYEISGSFSNSDLDKLYKEYEVAVSDPGWHVEGNKITKERKEWEKKYYGKTVGGFHKGDAYAQAYLRGKMKGYGYKKKAEDMGHAESRGKDALGKSLLETGLISKKEYELKYKGK